jgi:hypothetical protein
MENADPIEALGDPTPTAGAIGAATSPDPGD